MSRKPVERHRLYERPHLFGSAPMLEGEDRAAYEQFYHCVYKTVEPPDILEDTWVRDFVDCDWELRRLRRLKNQLLDAEKHYGVAEFLNPMLSDDCIISGVASRKLACEWARREAPARKQVDQLLSHANLSMEAVKALTLARLLDKIESIERMIGQAIRRRDNTLIEIERHRATLAYALKNLQEHNVLKLAPAISSTEEGAA